MERETRLELATLCLGSTLVGIGSYKRARCPKVRTWNSRKPRHLDSYARCYRTANKRIATTCVPAVRSTSMTSLQLHESGDAPSVAGVGKYSSGSNVTVACAFHHTAPISTCGGRGPIVGRHHPEQRSHPRFKSERVESCCLDRLQNLACVARKVESSRRRDDSLDLGHHDEMAALPGGSPELLAPESRRREADGPGRWSADLDRSDPAGLAQRQIANGSSLLAAPPRRLAAGRRRDATRGR